MSPRLPNGWWRHRTEARFPRRRRGLERALAEFEAEGSIAVERLRAMRPSTYLKLAACLLGGTHEAEDAGAK